ncbi:hypothetical protein [Mucilaginibacter sp.]|uniref:hypothetical protein n=1 Tax=Mucilaginibacter sp. TaxID=1882438 RepID=UPI0026383602|nr:hypothetical protein [Mucilaginibacter sp.]MDB5129324.1 hypothetical protein [Mucilaginibacter sp.]
MEIDLTNSELFKSFAEFEQEELHIDLHTEFDCDAIDFSSSKKQLKLSFKPNKYCKCEVKSVEVVFDDCTIERYCSKFDRTNTDSGTLDIMYRGRFEIGNDELGEISRAGLYYYYINFLPDVDFELFARSVKAKVNLI